MTDDLDDVDREILARIARDDPPPPDLDERVMFALALTDVDAEVARLARRRRPSRGRVSRPGRSPSTPPAAA